MHNLLITAKSYVFRYQALLSGGDPSLTRKKLEAGHQELALFAAVGDGWGELQGSAGYERQPAPRWDFSSSGTLINRDPVEFPIRAHDCNAGRLTLLLDGEPALSGHLVRIGFDVTLPGRDRISIERRTLNLRL